MPSDSNNPENPAICPICKPDMDNVVECDARSLLIQQGSGLILAPRRHVQRWRDLTEVEQVDLSARLGPAQGRLENGSNIAPVSLIENEVHCHFHINAPDKDKGLIPGAPHDRALISGGDDALHAHLRPLIDQAHSVDIAVSFLMTSGVRLILPHLRDLLDRGGKLRLLTGDYLGVTDPKALRLMLDLEHSPDLYIFQANRIPFHPKAWMFNFEGGAGALIVGSSNLSGSALGTGVEWNLRHFDKQHAPPLTSAREAFEDLLKRPEVTKLTTDWVDCYESRRIVPSPSISGTPAEPIEDEPTPHGIQLDALAALALTRDKGYRAGLVVLATGLGKTFLAAFDSKPYSRVLFVAHREEILAQAMATFRAIRPRANLGRLSATEKDFDAEVLFASIQTLSRDQHLRQFATDAFDYIIIDEFHHAAAATYRRIIDHFTPDFLLGLTATPDRSDGGDLLGLCEENLVYECDLWTGIDRKLLSPFKYFGVPDPVEYAQIPWRNGKFDENELTNAVATQARAENALEQLAERGGKKTIGFCVSRRHADFMAHFALSHGLRAVAVHSGESSAPRASALKALESGDLDIIFAVDMFNEGVDVPSIDTVLMLRPTESPIIWLQQLGRGLRLSAEKSHLAVIDYIGNHRIFLTKARTLLRVATGEGALKLALERFESKEIVFPDGCEVTYDLEALDILKSLIRQPRDGEELAAFYRDFRDRHGIRPTASEVQHAGFNPSRTGHEGWIGFVKDMGDLSAAAASAWNEHKGLLDEIETTRMTRSYKMLVLRAMIEAGALPGRIAVQDIVDRVARMARRNPAIKSDLSVDPENTSALRSIMVSNPLKILGDTEWFKNGPGTFETVDHSSNPQLTELASELVDWRILRYLTQSKLSYPEPTTAELHDAADPGAVFNHGPRVWEEYRREDIPPLFGATFNTGAWQAGIVVVQEAKSMILLVTMDKTGLSAGEHYTDHFSSPTHFTWQTQTSTRRNSQRGRIISGEEPGWTKHLFIRKSKLRDGKGAPFRYAGPVDFEGWEGEGPITVELILRQEIPTALQALLLTD